MKTQNPRTRFKKWVWTLTCGLSKGGKWGTPELASHSHPNWELLGQGRPYHNTQEEEPLSRTSGDNLRSPHHAYTPTRALAHTHVSTHMFIQAYHTHTHATSIL